ncbi:MAG: AraC family transcriptional regulator [Bacteroidia bacterium]|nr:AraC family transcriptional regulator [Bacteroidia bacterium]
MLPIVTVKAELTAEDCLRIVERHKRTFTYPIHRHTTVELNFVQHGKGVRRIVRDSSEVIGEYDLSLIGENVEHVWEQGECSSSDVREITIHFSANLFDGNFIGKKQFASIRKMLENSRHGLVWGMDTIMEVYSLLNALASEQNGFEQFLLFQKMLHILSNSPSRQLTSSPEPKAVSPATQENDPIALVAEYLKDHYTSEEVNLTYLSRLAGMSPTALSRVFKQKKGITLSAYLIDLKLQNAARRLIDTDEKVADICKSCGFNNLSNFNRTFKARKGKTPKDYRSLYKKNKITV